MSWLKCITKNSMRKTMLLNTTMITMTTMIGLTIITTTTTTNNPWLPYPIRDEEQR